MQMLLRGACSEHIAHNASLSDLSINLSYFCCINHILCHCYFDSASVLLTTQKKDFEAHEKYTANV